MTRSGLRINFFALGQHLKVTRSALDGSVLPGSANLPVMQLLRGSAA